jgi:hypothetical protein
MDLQTRRPIIPPHEVIAALRGLARTADYRELPRREGRAGRAQEPPG